MSEIGTVGVVGAGTMGHGIAQVAAQAGFAVRLVDLSPEALAKGLAAIGGSLGKLAAKGRLTAEEAAAAAAALAAREGQAATAH